MSKYLLITLLVISFQAQSAVFRCKDKDGSTTFSDTPCGDNRKKVMQSATPERDARDEYNEKVRAHNKSLRQNEKPIPLLKDVRPHSPVDALKSMQRDKANKPKTERERLWENVKRSKEKVRKIQRENYDPEKCAKWTETAKLYAKRDGFMPSIDYYESTNFMSLYCHK